MDPFEKKRGMIQELLSMLKKHASDEVSTGLSKPNGEGDMHGVQVEKVELLPDHKMDEPTPEHDVETKELNAGGMAYNKGGVVDKVNATDPTPKIHSGEIPYESENGKPDMEGAVEKEAAEPLDERETEATEESMHPAFAAFLGKRKKK